MTEPGTLQATVAAILDRDLSALRRELEAYPDERQIWVDVPGLPNSAGTLALHLAGNVRHYIGAQWGATGYVRDRDAEFSARGVSRAELLDQIEETRAAVAAGMGALKIAGVEPDYPETVAGFRLATADYLVHLCTHVTYHLGQLDAHRRFVTGRPEAIGALRLDQLASARPMQD